MNHSWSFPLRASKASAAGAVFLALLTGCGGSGGAEQPSASSSAADTPSSSAGAEPSASGSATASASASAEYKPATADGPAENVPVPEMPAVAKEHTKEGYEAFVRYWVDLVNYSNESGTTEIITSLTNRNCGSCKNIIGTVEYNADNGRWMVGGKWEVESVYTSMAEDTQGYIRGQMIFNQAAIKTYSEGGVEASSASESGELRPEVILEYSGESWILIGIGTSEGAVP